MAIGDVYEIRLQGEYLGQVILNVFHYQSAGTADISEPLLTVAAAVGTLIITDVVPTQVESFQWLSSYAKHLVEGGAEATFPFTGGEPGLQTGEGLPPHDAWAFRYNRTNTTTRHGQKRFAGVPEAQALNGVAASGALTALNELADTLERDITSADGFSAGEILRPVIYSQFLNGELRGSVVDGVFVPAPISNPVSSVQYVRISTQNTRKIYR